MEQKKWDIHTLSNELLQSVRKYGIKELSIEQYEFYLQFTVARSLTANYTLSM